MLSEQALHGTPRSNLEDGMTFWPWRIITQIKATPEGSSVYDTIVQRFAWWCSSFDLFTASHVAITSPIVMVRIARLRPQKRLWTALLWHRDTQSDTQKESMSLVLRAIVDQAEIVAQMSNLQQATFTFDGAVIPALAFAGCSTDDLHLLRRIVVILKALNTSEGVWDSEDVAEIFKTLLFARPNPKGLDSVQLAARYRS
jgi:hypothetical protein